MRRNQFLIGAGLGLAVTVLAACTSKAQKSEAPGESTTAPTAATAARGPGDAIASTADVPVGSGVIVGDIVITQPAAGDFKGFSATCTHNGCTLNKVADGAIDCPCHGSKFNLDGSVARGPAKKPLKSEAISVRGDSIVLG
jgi:Rieske Fe-S protein